VLLYATLNRLCSLYFPLLDLAPHKIIITGDRRPPIYECRPYPLPHTLRTCFVTRLAQVSHRSESAPSQESGPQCERASATRGVDDRRTASWEYGQCACSLRGAVDRGHPLAHGAIRGPICQEPTRARERGDGESHLRFCSVRNGLAR
jgi:hypothetical protein